MSSPSPVQVQTPQSMPPPPQPQPSPQPPSSQPNSVRYSKIVLFFSNITSINCRRLIQPFFASSSGPTPSPGGFQPSPSPQPSQSPASARTPQSYPLQVPSPGPLNTPGTEKLSCFYTHTHTHFLGLPTLMYAIHFCPD